VAEDNTERAHGPTDTEVLTMTADHATTADGRHAENVRRAQTIPDIFEIADRAREAARR